MRVDIKINNAAIIRAMIVENERKGQVSHITPETLKDLQEAGVVQELVDAGFDIAALVTSELNPDEDYIVVCTYATTPPPYTDNIDEPCAKCGKMITHRPVGYPENASYQCILCTSPETVNTLQEELRDMWAMMINIGKKGTSN